MMQKPDDTRSFFLALGISVAILVVWQYFFPVEPPKNQIETATQGQSLNEAGGNSVPSASAGRQLETAPATPFATAVMSREEALAKTRRIAIENSRVYGSINLVGGRLDDLTLKSYKETIEPNSPMVTLLSPQSTKNPYYADFGWVNSAGGDVPTPGQNTEWQVADDQPLTPQHPVVLTWNNGKGLEFIREFSIDDNYMFEVINRVRNSGENSTTLFPYGLVARETNSSSDWRVGNFEGYYILHVGMIGVFGEEGLVETPYKDLEPDAPEVYEASDGWMGMTGKYWATALIPGDSSKFKARYIQLGNNPELPKFQADFAGSAQTIPAGGQIESKLQFFAGAKEVNIIEGYQDTYSFNYFDRLIDWGWFYPLNHTLFVVMNFLFHLIGDFGLAILATTVLIKLLFFPLANKAYTSMSKMKVLQPEMKSIQERYKEDRQKLQTEIAALYKREKVNPLAGCLPMLLQIPVFFALYKVLFVTIEMRHVPFFGWISDLSAPDPTNLFNLFGLIPWMPPSFLHLGAWPLIMGITMVIQMRLNPPPTDPTQAMVFNLMPIFFTFILATFPAGLIIYYSWNNLLTIVQQSIIMKRQGVKIDLLGNMVGGLKKRTGKK